MNPFLVDVLPDVVLDELIVDSPETEPHSKKDFFLIEKAFNARRAVGSQDGETWFEEGDDTSLLPQTESEIIELICGSGEYEPTLDRFPATVRLWVLRHWTRDKILHDERESYLASFLRGVVAAKKQAEKEKRKAEKTEKRAAQEVRLVKTKLLSTKNLNK